MNNQNNCTNYREDIAALVLGLLKPKETEILQKHIETCQDCKSFYQGLLNEEKDIRSSFNEIAQKGEFIQNSLIEKLKDNEQSNLPPHKITKITKIRLIKFAAAAVIIVAVSLFFNNSSAPVFGFDDVIAAVNNAQWMHFKYVNFNPAVEANKIYNKSKLTGTWFAVNPRRSITIHTNNIIYDEMTLGKQIVYYPKSNTITIQHTLKSEREYENIADLLAEFRYYEKERGAKITYRSGRLDGRPVMIMNSSSKTHNVTMYIDPKTRLPIKAQHNNLNGKPINPKIYLVYDFPEKGPEDIYQAGAPRDAKVVIIRNPFLDQTPEVLELRQALRRYNTARDNLLSDYILISTYEYDSAIRMLDVVNHQWKNPNANQRKICYSTRDIAEFLNDKTTNFETLHKWSENQGNNYQSISIDDHGRNYFSAWKGIYDSWITEGKRNWPLYINTLQDWGWPTILPKTNVHKIENDYSMENGLVAFEVTTEPEIINDILMNAAQKNIYYMDPSHDYMCVRKEEYQHFVMGRTPIDDINFDVNEISNEISCVQNVKEFGQTEEGQWYPKKIEFYSKTWDANGNAQPLSLSFIVSLYLKANSVFPERFFNPDMNEYFNRENK